MLSKSRLPLFAALFTLLALLAPLAAAQEGAPAGEAMSDADAFRGLGMMISQQLAPLGVTDAELDLIIAGIRAGLAGDSTVDPRVLMPKIQEIAGARAKKAGDAERKEAAAFLDKKAADAKAAGGMVTDSGLIYTVETAGDGASPGPTDRVKVHYHGTLRTGEVFDSSRERGEPVSFGLNEVIPCWTEGVQKMKVGTKAELVCPSDLAYGDRQAGKIPPGSALIFEVELLEILPAG